MDWNSKLFAQISVFCTIVVLLCLTTIFVCLTYVAIKETIKPGSTGIIVPDKPAK